MDSRPNSIARFRRTLRPPRPLHTRTHCSTPGENQQHVCKLALSLSPQSCVILLGRPTLKAHGPASQGPLERPRGRIVEACLNVGPEAGRATLNPSPTNLQCPRMWNSVATAGIRTFAGAPLDVRMGRCPGAEGVEVVRCALRVACATRASHWVQERRRQHRSGGDRQVRCPEGLHMQSVCDSAHPCADTQRATSAELGHETPNSVQSGDSLQRSEQNITQMVWRPETKLAKSLPGWIGPGILRPSELRESPLNPETMAMSKLRKHTKSPFLSPTRLAASFALYGSSS